MIVPPEGYLKAIRNICDRHNVLLIADEIQSGLGRAGQLLASSWESVAPDLVTLGKALSGGMMPVSAVVGNRNILGLVEPGSHGSTFGGNPLASAVAREALRVIVEEDLPKRAREMGAYLCEGLRQINSPHIKEIRGKGLLIGVEFKPEAGHARAFVRALKARGVLAKDTHGTVIRFAPPLVITRDEVDFLLEQAAVVFASASVPAQEPVVANGL